MDYQECARPKCKAPVVQPLGSGRRREYCSPSCRTSTWRQRQRKALREQESVFIGSEDNVKPNRLVHQSYFQGLTYLGQLRLEQRIRHQKGKINEG